MKYTWTVTGLATETIETQENYVVVASFNVTGTDGGFTSVVNGTQNFSLTSETFIPYEDLTNEIVVSWIKELVNVAEITNFIDAEIETQKNPPIQPINQPLPWN